MIFTDTILQSIKKKKSVHTFIIFKHILEKYKITYKIHLVLGRQINFSFIANITNRQSLLENVDCSPSIINLNIQTELGVFLFDHIL